MEPRFSIIKKDELPDAVPRRQLDLLRGGLRDVLVVTLLFKNKESAWLQVREQNLSQFICGIFAVELAVPPDLKGHVGQIGVTGPVIFLDQESGFGPVF